MAVFKILASAIFCMSGVFSAVNFGADEVTQLRDDIRELIEDNEKGINENSTTLEPEDILFKFELPIIASSVRLAFHDCAGEFPTKCDGCLDFPSNSNDGLWEGSAGPLSSICNEYKTNYQLSIADCWALAATFSLELSSELSDSDWQEINTFYNGNLNNNDFPTKTVTPGDIPYYIGRIDCDNAPDIVPGTIEDFPGPPDSWQIIQHYFGDRFDLNSKETVALIVGGHSLGRSHLSLTNRAGPWDVSPNTADNGYAKALLGENRVLEPFNWQSGRPFRRPQFFIENEDFTDVYGDPFVVDQAFMMFFSDISLAYNRSFYIANRLQPECFTLAEEFCATNYPGSIVLYPGDSDDINDYPPGTTLCPQVQCPLQCIGGQDEVDSYKNNDYVNLPDTYEGCPVAWIRQFADDDDEFAETFVRAYTTVITAGYQIAPIKAGNSGSGSSSSSSDDNDFIPDPNVDYLYEININYDNLDSSDSSSE